MKTKKTKKTGFTFNNDPEALKQFYASVKEVHIFGTVFVHPLDKTQPTG